MAFIRLHGPLRRMAGDAPEHPVAGATVAQALVALEDAQPSLRGWVLDERGHLRRHLKVFVNGDDARQESAVEPGDRIDVLPAISGG